AEGSLSCRHSHGVRDGKQGRPLRRAGAGSADLEPATLSGISHGVVDGEAGVGIPVVSYIRYAPFSVQVIGNRIARLVGRFRFQRPLPPAAATPRCLTQIVAT